jgi:Domain of unknown function (DUF4404)
MADDKLRELLAGARARLSPPPGADPGAHQAAHRVIRDVEIALGSGNAAAQAPRLEALAAQFEANHPQVAETLREIIDALVKAGI